MSNTKTNQGELNSGKYNNRLYWQFTWSAEKINGEPGKSLVTWTLVAKGRRYKGDDATWFATTKGALLKVSHGETTYIQVDLSKLYPYDTSNGGDPLVCYDGHQHVPSSYKVDGKTISNTFIYEHPIEANEATLTAEFVGLNKIYSTTSKEGGYNASATWTLYENLPYGVPGAPQGKDVTVTKASPSVGDTITFKWKAGTAGANGNQIKEYEAQYKVGSGSWEGLTKSNSLSTQLLIKEEWRGKQISFRVRSIAVYGGLKSEYTTKTNIATVIKSPKTPLVSISTDKYRKDGKKYILPNNGADVTFSLQKGENDPEAVQFYYSTSESGEKTSIEGTSLSLSIKTNATYWFWSKLDKEYCETGLKIEFEMNELPAFIMSETYVDACKNGYAEIWAKANKEVKFTFYFQLLKNDKLYSGVPVDAYEKFYLLGKSSEKQTQFSIESLSVPGIIYQKITEGRPLKSDEKYYWQIKVKISDGLDSVDRCINTTKEGDTTYFESPRFEGMSTDFLYNKEFSIAYVPSAEEPNKNWQIIYSANINELRHNKVIKSDGKVTYEFNTSNLKGGEQISIVVFNKGDLEREFAMLLDQIYIKRQKYYPPEPKVYSYSVYAEDSYTFTLASFSEYIKPCGILTPSGGLPNLWIWKSGEWEPNLDDEEDLKANAICITSESDISNTEAYHYHIADPQAMYAFLFGENNAISGTIKLKAGIENRFKELYITPEFDFEVQVHRVQSLRVKAFYALPPEHYDLALDEVGWCELGKWKYLKEGMPIRCSFDLELNGYSNITETDVIFEVQADSPFPQLTGTPELKVELEGGSAPEVYDYETRSMYKVNAYLGDIPPISQKNRISFLVNIKIDGEWRQFHLAESGTAVGAKYDVASHYGATIEIVDFEFNQDTDKLTINWRILDNGVECNDQKEVFMLKTATEPYFSFANCGYTLSYMGEGIVQEGDTYTSYANICIEGTENLIGVERFSVAPQLKIATWAVLNDPNTTPGTIKEFFKTEYTGNCLEWRMCYNDVPSIAYRPNCIGINTYFENFDKYDPDSTDLSVNNEGQAILMIYPTDSDNNAATGTKKLIVLRGERDAIVNVEEGNISDFIIDCGTW